jgi:hypothetical protein
MIFMISNLHLADEHAPFPHRIVSGTAHHSQRIRPNQVLKWDTTFAYVICDICGHYISGDEATATRCRCSASCHNVEVYPSM